MKILQRRILALFIAITVGVVFGAFSAALAAVPGGTLDPTTVPKYVTPLVIPPVMPATGITGDTPQADLDIAVRQFKQQILPGGIWDNLGGTSNNYPPTTVWSYGSASDPMPDSSALGGGLGVAPAANSSFNYPAFTVENVSGVMNKVRWRNELVEDPVACFYGSPTGTSCNYLTHLLPVDQTLHWANPSNADCYDHMTGTFHSGTDCETLNQLPYGGRCRSSLTYTALTSIPRATATPRPGGCRMPVTSRAPTPPEAPASVSGPVTAPTAWPDRHSLPTRIPRNRPPSGTMTIPWG